MDPSDFEADLHRRQGGQGKGTTPRKEADIPQFASGIFDGYTTGSPITILFENRNTRASDYALFREAPRPGHADFVAGKKYAGYADMRGSGHFSGRLTVALVAAGVVAKKIIAPMEVRAIITEIGGHADWTAVLAETIHRRDSLGGIVECTVCKVPVGLGEPFFGGVEAVLSSLLFAIPAVKGVEFGAGFDAARMYGSTHNDAFISRKGKTRTNYAGGINGGITNGNDLVLRVAVKPTSSIGVGQKTLNMTTGKPVILEVSGRHDTCIALRVPPVAEAATAIGLADLFLMYKKYAL